MRPCAGEIVGCQAAKDSTPDALHRELFSQMSLPAPRFVMISTAGETTLRGIACHLSPAGPLLMHGTNQQPYIHVAASFGTMATCPLTHVMLLLKRQHILC